MICTKTVKQCCHVSNKAQLHAILIEKKSLISPPSCKLIGIQRDLICIILSFFVTQSIVHSSATSIYTFVEPGNDIWQAGSTRKPC